MERLLLKIVLFFIHLFIKVELKALSRMSSYPTAPAVLSTPTRPEFKREIVVSCGEHVTTFWNLLKPHWIGNWLEIGYDTGSKTHLF
jgi:hypothetical protein